MAAPPCFLQILPIETDATDGDIVTFQVKVSSDPSDPTVVSWWRCGESLRPMPGHLEMIEHEDGWHELILSNITEEDEGEYECRAENHRGHNSCFGSLYYYQEGGGTLTDVAMAGMTEEGDGRQSGLLILIDDGSHTEEESLSGHSDRKSMTVSEQMQGIIEDLTQSSQGEHTGSITLEKEDDNQFCSDIEDLCDDDLEANIIQNILGMKKQGSEETLIPEMPSPDLTGDVAYSEGASDPYAPTAPSEHHKWRSNPNDVSKEKRDKQEAKEKQTQGVWPPEPSGVTFYLPQDNTVTTSVELPYTRDSSSTTEEAPKGSWRCADTPFDVADITEETADVDSSSKDAGSLRQSPTDGSSKVPEESEGVVGPLAPDSRVASRIDTTSLTSVSQISGEAIHPEGCQLNKMSFTKSSFKASSYQYTDDGLMDTSTSVRTTSVTSRLSSTTFDQESVSVQQRSVRRELEDDSFTFSSKKTRLTSAYEADESSLSTSHRAVQDSFLTESIMEGRGIDVYVAIMDFKPMGSDEEAVAMKEGQRVEVIDASKPRRWLVRTIPMTAEECSQEGWVPACYLEKSTAFDTLSSYVVTEAELDPKELEALQNREAIVKELVETEEDFAKDMQYVVDNYYKQMDNPRLPKEFRDRKGSVFGNFKDISDFHNNVLMKGVNYHAKEPTKLGKTFLRLERDFDMHASYCWNEARAQRLLKEGPLKEFFDDHSRMIDDDKFLIDHLKLPIQRLNDYQLLLKELIKYSSRLNEDTADLQKALDFIHSINTRTKDLQYILAIEGCKGDLLKIGRILNHEIFDVYEGNEVSSSERYVFLFKGRVFVTEKRVTSDKESYHVTNLFRLQDVDLIDTVDGDALKILFKSHKKNRPGFPLSLRARSAEQKSSWLKELLNANQVVEDLGDLEPSLEHSLVASNEQLAEKSNDIIEPAEDEKPKTALKRQDSVKKSKGEKTPDSSVPQTPTEADAPRSLKRQESVKKSKRSGDTSAPETPTETFEKPPKLLRQDSKKSKASDSSAPETPTEVLDKRPKLSRQDSKKSKTSDSSAPETPVESSEKPPPLSRQDSKKSKASDVSAPETPVESSEKPPPLSRQDSKKSKASDVSAPETPVESSEKPPLLSRQDSKKSKASDVSTPGTPVESSEKSPLSRQDSKKSKASDVSAPGTPVESSEKSPLSRQDSKKSKTSDVSAPETPVESSEKPPSFSRQDSKKSKASDASAPGTPVETSEKPPPLSRQDSKKSQASAPETPTESKEPRLARQDSKKSKTSDTSEPATPTDTTTAAPALTRQDSVKKKQKKQSVIEKEEEKVVPISEEKEAPLLARQESVSKKTSDKRKAEEEESKSKLRRQESLTKKEEEDKKKSKQGEEPCGVPTIIMSEDASASEARMESMELGCEDSATLASESIRSDSVTPPGSGAYQKPSLPSSTFAYYHVLILIPILCACYVFTQFWSTFT